MSECLSEGRLKRLHLHLRFDEVPRGSWLDGRLERCCLAGVSH